MTRAGSVIGQLPHDVLQACVAPRIQTFAIGGGQATASAGQPLRNRDEGVGYLSDVLVRDRQDLRLDPGMLGHEHQRGWPRPLNVELDPPKLLDRQIHGRPPLGRHDHPSIGDQDAGIAGPGFSLNDLVRSQEVAHIQISSCSHRTLPFAAIALPFTGAPAKVPSRPRACSGGDGED